MTEKEQIKKAFENFMEDNRTRLSKSVNGMMAAEYVDADPAARSVTLRFPVLPWEGNRVGMLHGGIMAAMLDHVSNLTVSYYLGHWAPTLSMNLDYIHPASMGDSLLATASILSHGKKIIRITGRLVSEKNGKLIATCTASFFNKGDTSGGDQK